MLPPSNPASAAKEAQEKDDAEFVKNRNLCYGGAACLLLVPIFIGFAVLARNEEAGVITLSLFVVLFFVVGALLCWAAVPYFVPNGPSDFLTAFWPSKDYENVPKNAPLPPRAPAPRAPVPRAPQPSPQPQPYYTAPPPPPRPPPPPPPYNNYYAQPPPPPPQPPVPQAPPAPPAPRWVPGRWVV